VSRESLSGSHFRAIKGAEIDLKSFQGFLNKNGYLRTETVREPGEYAMRGGIVDLFPPGYEEP
ncbi:MAG TPA: hypothetical protein DEA55_06670, partial [Rhodospirillaceae bacterium]|nr:hypothetical protein [Rhodospirillaceae bacterium]